MSGEPTTLLGRPTGMRILGTAAVVLLLALSGCGQAEDAGETSSAGGTSSSAPATPPAWGSCTADDLAGAAGPTGRLETDQGVVTVTLVTDPTGPCAEGLVARGEGAVWGVDVGDRQLDPATAQVVSLAGPGDDPAELIRVDSEAHPRGGFQPHLFTLTPAGLVEVTQDGGPLLPFVATDGGAPPMTAVCAEDGGVGLLVATVSKPPGVVLAWDVQLTTYDVSAGEAVVTSDEQIRDHAADPTLREEMPELFDAGALFADCSRTWGG